MLVRSSFRSWFQDHATELAAIILDIDGVLLRGARALPGSRELLSQLRSREVPIGLLTNDGNNSIREKRTYLAQCGLDFAEDEIVSSGNGLVEVVQDRSFAGKRFLVVGRLGDPCYAEEAGVLVTRDVNHLDGCVGVILGEEDYDWEPAVNAVANFFIAHPEAPFIVPNPDTYFPTRNGGIRVAAGGVARFITQVLEAYGVGVEPVFLGKPFEPIFRHCHESLERRTGTCLVRERVMMVGDSLYGDIRGANGFGYRSALVLTGVTTSSLLKSSEDRPELVFREL